MLSFDPLTYMKWDTCSHKRVQKEAGQRGKTQQRIDGQTQRMKMRPFLETEARELSWLSALGTVRHSIICRKEEPSQRVN